MEGFVVEVYASGPFFSVLVFVDALIFGNPISRSLIATVLGVCAYTQIDPAVVEAVVVDMVNG